VTICLWRNGPDDVSVTDGRNVIVKREEERGDACAGLQDSATNLEGKESVDNESSGRTPNQ
jgi:hypothetical protein